MHTNTESKGAKPRNIVYRDPWYRNSTWEQLNSKSIRISPFDWHFYFYHTISMTGSESFQIQALGMTRYGVATSETGNASCKPEHALRWARIHYCHRLSKPVESRERLLSITVPAACTVFGKPCRNIGYGNRSKIVHVTLSSQLAVVWDVVLCTRWRRMYKSNLSWDPRQSPQWSDFLVPRHWIVNIRIHGWFQRHFYWYLHISKEIEGCQAA